VLKRFVAAGALALSVAAGSLAAADQAAQPNPYPTPPPVPTNAKIDPYSRYAIDVLANVLRQQILNLTNSTAGRVSYFKRFEMQVQTGPNAYREIRLHQGTVINPRGATIAVGQHVEVGGYPQPDGTLDASVITIDQ
jgi:hypothetical protein